MAREKHVVALYSLGWEQLERNRMEHRLQAGVPTTPAWAFVTDFDAIDSLVNQVQAEIDIDPDHPCLKSLEIVAHGEPVSCDGMDRSDAGTWATKLKQLPWCDVAAIYLSGCNTGLARDRGDPGVMGPVAKLLADAMPFDAAAFVHRISVYGAAGYISGANASRDEAVTLDYSTGWLFWRVDYETYKGARTASGAQSWNEFKNGTW